jgi:hypothetical protein
VFFRVKSDIAHQLLLKLYLRTPSMIQHLVIVELDKFLAGASVTGNVNLAVLGSFVQY